MISKNFPQRDVAGNRVGIITCVPTVDGGFDIFCNDWQINTICAATLEGQARQIVSIIEDALDHGFDQGIDHVRKVLRIS